MQSASYYNRKTAASPCARFLAVHYTNVSDIFPSKNIELTNGYLRYSTWILLDLIEYNQHRFPMSSGFRIP